MEKGSRGRRTARACREWGDDKEWCSPIKTMPPKSPKFFNAWVGCHGYLDTPAFQAIPRMHELDATRKSQHEQNDRDILTAIVFPGLMDLMRYSVSYDLVGGRQPEKPAANAESVKLIQQHLILLLHALECQRRQEANGRDVNGERTRPCEVPHCKTMKKVLNHVWHCDEGVSCKVLHCSSSRRILNHWEICTGSDCSVCTSVRLRGIPGPRTDKSTAPNGTQWA